ncbi:MAG: prepilin-type N-terminal cleavage/methylation domain-containing protein [Betaproteobacteria bacterium]|nr:prepilin-type N-terminal cleavage/methylation domain-containing protein [Betaproteobacteria bacterium]MCL2885999.1 prepilin-type N-terminal cleavage/methylation domain-containing protein [Betaproteobacteria bacterium]
MKSRQQGFTLVEIAIVLVIIGLLLGGVLKGQELINSAKVKNFANDFRTIPLYIYGYQDRFRALPGDDKAAATHVAGAINATTPAGSQGNGVIDGPWNSNSKTHESYLFWQHVRLAGFASGTTDIDSADYIPRNADGGIIGVTSNGSSSPIIGLRGTYAVCSQGILGRFAKQLDTMMDDGNTATGSMMTMKTPSANQTSAQQPVPSTGPGDLIDDAESYTVCLAF